VKNPRQSVLRFLTLEVLVVGSVFLASLGLFFYLTRVVFGAHSLAFDHWAIGQANALRAAWPPLTGVALFVTFFASLPFLAGAAVLVPAAMRWRGRRREALEVLLAVVGSSLFNQLLKTHFHRARPATALLPQPGLSFPSGHAMIGMALYGCLAWLLWRHGRHPVWAALLLSWAVLIGLTRIYLQVHYATDVLAGFAAGLLWLILLRTALRLYWREKQQHPG
jgi:membrane-associated phospholipid phosphatase